MIFYFDDELVRRLGERPYDCRFHELLKTVRIVSVMITTMAGRRMHMEFGCILGRPMHGIRRVFIVCWESLDGHMIVLWSNSPSLRFSIPSFKA